MTPRSYTNQTRFQEDGTAIIKARLAADDGTGAATGVNGEGYFIKIADLTSIIRLVRDITAGTSDTPTTLTLAEVIEDTPITTAALWATDEYGYNFADAVPASKFATGNNAYQVEYKITMTGGNVYWLKCAGPADKCYSS